MASLSELKASIVLGNGLARTNKFLIQLPTLGAGGVAGALGSTNMNVLCQSASLPGKQILTTDRRYGMEYQKVAYGYAVDDITLTFLETSVLPVRRYFDEWRQLILDEDTQIASYKNEYAKRVTIHQMASPLPLGQIPLLDAEIATYSIELIDAFPTTINSIEFSNEQDGYTTTSVQLSYTNWKRLPPGQISPSLNFF